MVFHFGLQRLPPAQGFYMQPVTPVTDVFICFCLYFVVFPS